MNKYFFYSFFLIIFILVVSDYLFLSKIIASQISSILNFFGYNTIVNNLVYINEYHVTKLCTGIYAVAVFLGLLIPLRFSVKKKIFYVVGSVFLIYVLNLLRIIIVLVLNMQGISWFVAHNIIGRGLAFIVLVLMFLGLFRQIPELKVEFDKISLLKR